MKRFLTILALAILIFSLTGCTFIGEMLGFTDSDSTSDLTSNNSNSGVNGNTPTTPTEVVISLDCNGGTVNDGQIISKTLRGMPGDTLTLPTLTREGYEFYGWCNGYAKYTGRTFPSSNMTLTARWTLLENRTITVCEENQNEYRSDQTSGLFANGWVPFKYDNSNSEMQKALDYFDDNNIASVNLKVTYDAWLFEGSKLLTSMGIKGIVKISGGNTGSVFHSRDITNYGQYETFTFSGTVNPKEFKVQTNGAGYINVLVDTNNYNYNMKVRNIKVEITYTEEAGTIV